jgi:capsular exopolysaccharide synthesis family protein
MKLPEGDAFTEDTQNYFGTQAELLRSGHLRNLAFRRLLEADATNALSKIISPPPHMEVRVYPFPKTSIFVVEAVSTNPGFAQLYLDALLTEYQSYKLSVRNEISGETLASISDQISRTQIQLKTDHEALRQFEMTNNIVSLSQEQATAGGYIATLRTRLADYELDSRLLESSKIEAGMETGNLPDSLIDSLNPTELQAQDSTLGVRRDTYKNIELLKGQRDRLGQNLRPQHPKMVKLNQDIERAEELAAIYRKQSKNQLENARQALEIRKARVTEAIATWEKNLLEANRQLAESDRLKSNITRSQALYDRLLAMLQTIDIRRNIERSALTVLEPASTALPADQRASSKLALGAFGGGLLGVAIVLVATYRDDRFTTSQEVIESLANPVIGQVPELNGPKRHALLEHNDKRHAFAESYRNLRSALLFSSMNGDRPKVLLITSAVPNEGKSTVAANLSRALAMGGAKVLLVDGDLRKGRLHEPLGLRTGPGLSEALREPNRLDEFIQSTSFPNLKFLPRGGDLGNPGDLFLSFSFNQLVARFKERFDFVFVDSSPLFAADDSTTIAPSVDATLLVMRSFYSRAGDVREAIDLLSQRRAGILGLVLNRADSKAKSYRYYKYADYSGAALREVG